MKKENRTVTAFAVVATNEVGVEEGIKNTVAANSKWYSRKEIEVMRNVNIGQQRKLWRNIYKRLRSEVGNEYDTLAAVHPLNHNNNNHKHYTPHPQCLPNKKPAPPILVRACVSRRALANALAAAPSMWTLGNAGMGVLQVVLVANSLPALNDVTAMELPDIFLNLIERNVVTLA
ncbi:hypothetical protein RIF29_30510 [Crotalaria pallida]|uniref:Uncharacterized protein n=1 Tax=Crotalaria pallida TaxID=3830 RepID=A0AAN9EN51_CROPI